MQRNAVPIVYLLGWLAVSTLPIASTSATDADLDLITRFREITDVVKEGFHPLKLKLISRQGDQLIGSAVYREKNGAPTFRCDGTETPDKRFWPQIVLAVADTLDGEWKSIAVPLKEGAHTSVALEFYKPNSILWIELDPFGPYIGKLRYGRVNLKNGAAAVFELSDLTASMTPRTSDRKSPDWENEIPSGYLENPIAKLPFSATAVISRHGWLQLVVDYYDPSSKSSIKLKGKRSSDGDFFPNVNLEVANDFNGEWQTIGPAPSDGAPAEVVIGPITEPTLMYVNVDILLREVGHYGYARAVIDGRASAAFELADLIAPADPAGREPGGPERGDGGSVERDQPWLR